MPEPNPEFMQAAIDLSARSVLSADGGPFGAVVVKEGAIIATGHNQVTSTCDPTAHAEIVALRQACQALQTFDLRGCELYTSCEPCPMCLSAIYWARLDRVYYANTQDDAAEIGFDDRFIYEQLSLAIGERQLPMVQFMAREARGAFQAWTEKGDKIEY